MPPQFSHYTPKIQGMIINQQIHQNPQTGMFRIHCYNCDKAAASFSHGFGQGLVESGWGVTGHSFVVCQDCMNFIVHP